MLNKDTCVLSRALTGVFQIRVWVVAKCRTPSVSI